MNGTETSVGHQEGGGASQGKQVGESDMRPLDLWEMPGSGLQAHNISTL